jgi:hypothetical protein
MSTADQILSSALHGEALLTARRPEMQPLIDHLREMARDDIHVECAGVIAGWWFADTACRGEDLIAAGLLMLAGHTDLDELDKWVRIGLGAAPRGIKPLPGQRGLGPRVVTARTDRGTRVLRVEKSVF